MTTDEYFNMLVENKHFVLKLNSIIELEDNLKENIGKNELYVFLNLEKSVDEWEIVTLLRKYSFSTIEYSRDKDFKSWIFVLEYKEEIKSEVINSFTVSCGKNTKECQISKNQKLPECCKEHLYEMLNFIDLIFKENELQYWLDGGTLLGAQRDNQIILWDNNINIGIMKSDLIKLKSLSKLLKIEGYLLESDDQYMKIYYSRKNKRSIKIYLYSKNNLNIFYNNFVFSIDSLFPLKTIQLDNNSYPCPADTQNFLKVQFGVDWDNPAKILKE